MSAAAADARLEVGFQVLGSTDVSHAQACWLNLPPLKGAVTSPTLLRRRQPEHHSSGMSNRSSDWQHLTAVQAAPVPFIYYLRV